MACACNSISMGGNPGNESALISTIERFTADRFSTLGRYFVHDLKRNWNAIAIGSRSMFDRCFIIPGAQNQDPAAKSALIDNLDMYMAQAIEVSVERPHIGHVEGPVIIAPGYSQSVANGTRLSAMIDRNANTTIGLDANLASNLDDALVPNLDLVLYSRVPPFIPTKRAPWDYVCRIDQLGSTGSNDGIVTLPGWGRNRWHIALKFVLVVGSADYRIEGFDAYSRSTGSISTFIETLVPTTTITAGTTFVTHILTEGFDLIKVTVTENAALSANSSFEILARGYD